MRTIIAILAGLGVAHAQNAEFRGDKGTVRLTGFADLSIDIPTGKTIARAEGTNLKVEDTGSGLTLTGKSMTITLRRTKAGETVVESAEVAGDARATIDSTVAYASQVAFAQRKGQPVPARPSEATQSTISSERMTYTLEGSEGILVVPTALAYTGNTVGTGERGFTQKMRAEGAAARITVTAPEGERKGAPRTARIEGPVQFFLDRNETKDGKPEVSNVRGRADLFVADFVTPKEPELTATGNVKVEGDFNGMPGTATGTQAVITLDRASYQPTRFRIIGSPVSTKVTIKEGKG